MKRGFIVTDSVFLLAFATLLLSPPSNSVVAGFRSPFILWKDNNTDDKNEIKLGEGEAVDPASKLWLGRGGRGGGGGGGSGHSQADLDNHANQMNPNNDAYWSSSRGYYDDDRSKDDDEDSSDDDEEVSSFTILIMNVPYSQAGLDNHANQMNPNNDAYYSSHGK